jgi:hypothetical protein
VKEDIPIYSFLAESFSMILGDHFESISFDPEKVLSESELEHAKIMAKPFAVAMLFNEMLPRLKALYPNMTAERLTMYFTNSARDTFELRGAHDPWIEGEDFIRVALHFLDFSIAFDINDRDTERDEGCTMKFVGSVLSEQDVLFRPNKTLALCFFGKTIEEGMKELTDHIFTQTNLTLPGALQAEADP